MARNKRERWSEWVEDLTQLFTDHPVSHRKEIKENIHANLINQEEAGGAASISDRAGKVMRKEEGYSIMTLGSDDLQRHSYLPSKATECAVM